ncbi:peptide-aspartate beta-dioxygenase [Aureococcus anophagefferens]|nr:peptide-aspartate beta-dioxygenase [Aureococcus anophagefferens]
MAALDARAALADRVRAVDLSSDDDDEQLSPEQRAARAREAKIMAKMASVLDEYCLSAIGKSVAQAYLRKLRDDDMERVRHWWLRKLNGRERAPEMRAELALRGSEGSSRTVAEGGGDRGDDLGKKSTDAGDWNVYYLELHNMDFAENRARCPVTCDVPRRYGHAFFSANAPKTHITAHNGPTAKKLRCHLPLVCPADPPGACRLRVADEFVSLAEGRAVVFDDSFNHEAWNDHASAGRIVLIFDVWHPDLSPKEVKLLSFLQTAAMKRDKRICDAQGVDADNFYAVIDKARAATPDAASIWA